MRQSVALTPALFNRVQIPDLGRGTVASAIVVPARPQVIVLADDAAHARIDRSVWHDVASRIAAAFARGDGTAGLIDGIDRLAGVLSEPLPDEPGDVDELPDQPRTGGFA